MWIELLPGMTNVLRFPVERRARPTLDLLRSLAPNIHEVLAIAITSGLELTLTKLRTAAHAEAAMYMRSASGDGLASHDTLDALLQTSVIVAIAASWSARDGSTRAAEAEQVLSRAKASGQGWLAPLRQRVEAMRLQAAELIMNAHAESEYAEGVASALGMAQLGDTSTRLVEDSEATATQSMILQQTGYKAVLRRRDRKRAPTKVIPTTPPGSQTGS